MDWQRLLHNRWALAGLGLAGVAGLYVLIKKRGQGAAGGPAQTSPAYSASGAVGGFDSTGTDVAHWLGSYSGFLDQQFNQFKTDVLAQLQNIPPADSGTGAPVIYGLPPGFPGPVRSPAPPSSPDPTDTRTRTFLSSLNGVG